MTFRACVGTSRFESGVGGQIQTMTVTEQKFEIKPAALFAILVDPTTYPKWLVGTKKIREVSPDWPAVDSWFKHAVGVGPIAIPDRTSVRAVEAPIMLELFVRARPAIEAVVRFDIIPNGGGCLLRMTETPAGLHKLISPVLQPIIRARNERSLQRLREQADQLSRTATPTPLL
ncbi:MAG: Polyketide cyclase/dehydrase [Acidimicrobiales bacterium]|nr:Polyketide cyclase/dehydrase [Acidimicrobiales bacterium]